MKGAGPFRVVEREGAAFLDVHAVPGSRREGIAGVHGGRLKVTVRASPEKGRANAALVTVIAKAAGVAPSKVEVVSGHASRRKRVRIDGLTAAELRARLGAALADA